MNYRLSLLSCVVGAAALLGAAGASAQSYIEKPTSSDFVRSLGATQPEADGDDAPLRRKDTTRGLRLNVAPAPATASVKAAPASATVNVASASRTSGRVEAPRGPSLNFPVQFEFGSDELTPQARNVLNELGAALSTDELKPYRFKLVGHTDAVGSEEYNLDLSKRRARAVEQYLLGKFGIAAGRVQALGVGKSQPFNAANPFDSVNRRVEIVREGRVES